MAVSKISQLASESATNETLLEELKKTTVSLGLTSEYRYYILMCGLFTADRNIIKFWKTYENLFMQLV
jgi:hypothetical protein